MAHEIEKNDHVAFTNAKPWWYRGTMEEHGTDMGEGLVTGEAIFKAAKIDFEVDLWSSFAVRPDMVKVISDLREAAEAEGITSGQQGSVIIPLDALIQHGDNCKTVRTDVNEILGDVSASYKTFQSRQLLTFMDAVLGESRGGMHYEVAGSLNNGRRVWMLARLVDPNGPEEGPGIVRADGSYDAYQDFLLGATRHDGMGAVEIMGTRVRVVCANTMNWALRGATNVFRIIHNQRLDDHIQEAREALHLQYNYFDALTEEMQGLEAERWDAQKNRDWVASVMVDMKTTMDDAKGIIAAQARERGKPERAEIRAGAAVHGLEDVVEKATHLFKEGKGNHGETKADGMQGLIEFLDHQQARFTATARVNAAKMAERRMEDIMYGDTAKKKQRGVEMLTRW